MTRKTFAIIAVAGLAALAGLASGLRPNSGPAETAEALAAGPSIETTVVHRTELVPKRSDTRQTSAPRPTTSASATGDDDDHERADKDEDEHKSEHADDGEHKSEHAHDGDENDD